MIDLSYAISRQLSALSQKLNLLVLVDGCQLKTSLLPLAFVKSW
jgi:hypothetical protein